MPAISPARLQRETDALFQKLDDLDAFLRGLENLLDAYADRTVRPARSGASSSLLPAFHAPRPVIRKLENGLVRFAADTPERALRLAERLWGLPEAEYKHLAVSLLGLIPGEQAGSVAEIVTAWVSDGCDEELLDGLFSVGIRADQNRMVALVEARLEGDGMQRTQALDYLSAVIRSASDDVLPGIFQLLRRVMDQSRVVGSSRLLTLARNLAARAPVETAFFLRQQYLVALRPEYGRLIRQCMPAFPEQVQRELRRMMRENPVEG